jgi:hypothetical protein
MNAVCFSVRIVRSKSFTERSICYDFRLSTTFVSSDWKLCIMYYSWHITKYNNINRINYIGKKTFCRYFICVVR